jgi:hypothetical protein
VADLQQNDALVKLLRRLVDEHGGQPGTWKASAWLSVQLCWSGMCAYVTSACQPAAELLRGAVFGTLNPCSRMSAACQALPRCNP